MWAGRVWASGPAIYCTGEATTRTDDVDPCWRDELASTQAKVVKDYGFSLSSALSVISILRVSSQEVTTGIMIRS